MPKKKAYNKLKIRAYIDKHHPPSLDFNLDEGIAREMCLEGRIDDPYQSILGDIFENEAGSKFSWAPILINLYQDDDNIDELSKSFDKKAIGNLAVRKNVEIQKFNYNGEEHIDPPVNVWMNLPKDIFESVSKTAELNKNHKKLGWINFEVKVAQKHLLDPDHDGDSVLYPRLKDLDVSKNRDLELPIMGFSFGQTIFDQEYATQSSRVKTLGSKHDGADFAITPNKVSWSFNAQTGDYDRIEIEGKAKKEQYSFNSDKIDVAIDLKRFWWFASEIIEKNKLPEQCEYGRYHYSSDSRYLSVDLAYHPEDLENVFKPILFNNNLDNYRILISFDEKLKFDKDQEGKVQSYTIRRDFEKINKANESNEEAQKSLADLDYKLTTFIQTSEQRFNEFSSTMEKAGVAKYRDNSEIMKKLDSPTDIVSRIVLKIPIIGPILKFLAR